MENLFGVVLCGGESRRMGSDKGLLQTNGKTWAQHIAAKLSALGIPAVVSINEQQLESYGDIFSAEQLVIDSVDIKGPLKGLLSVHEQYPSKNILLMACDLIDMDEATLKNLIEHYQNNEAFDFYVYHKDFAEPFCAIYTARGLKSVLDKARTHSLLKFSFQNLLEEGKTFRIEEYDESSFKNYNTIPGHHQET
jgi:molybdopterin-guanine dinucleotide biosynthesis protein A